MISEAGKVSSATWRDVPTSVWTLGFVSLLMDISSELIHSLLPVFLVTVVGAGTVAVGLIEGIAEATAAMAKVFSGALSDRIGKRKLLVGIGYGPAAITKPVFPLASTARQVLALALIPLVSVWMNVVYAITATPAGILSDKIGRMKLLLCGLGALFMADLTLAFVPGLGGVFAGVALWGLYLGFSQGLLSALVADTAPEDLRGTAFGLFNLLTGGALLVAGAVFAGTAALIMMSRMMRSS